MPGSVEAKLGSECFEAFKDVILSGRLRRALTIPTKSSVWLYLGVAGRPYRVKASTSQTALALSGCLQYSPFGFFWSVYGYKKGSAWEKIHLVMNLLVLCVCCCICTLFVCRSAALKLFSCENDEICGGTCSNWLSKKLLRRKAVH